MTDPHDMLLWASLCFVTVLITFCFYFLLFSFYVCLVRKTCKSFDRKKTLSLLLKLRTSVLTPPTELLYLYYIFAII